MSTNKYTIRYYWQRVRHYKPSFFIMLVGIPAATLCIDTLLPYYLAQAIGGLADGNQDFIVRHLLIATVVGVFGVLCNLIGFQAITRHEANVRADLMNDTFADVIHKDLRFFTNTKVGALTSRYIDFVRSHVVLQDLLIIRTLGFVLSVGVGLVILFVASPPVAVVIAALIVTLLLQVRWSIKKRAPLRHERKELTGAIHGQVADSITNNMIVKTFAREGREIAILNEMNQRYRTVFRKDIGFISYEGTARVAVMIILQLVAIAVAVYMVFTGQLLIATAIFVLTYLQRIGSQIFVLGEMINGYDEALLAAAPMSDILAQPTQITDAPDALPLTLSQPSIEFDRVSYGYDDSDKPVIKDLSLLIPAGQKVGLVGHSGAGKTTITHLLLRFDDVTRGTILIGDQPVTAVTQNSLRQHMSYVPQEPMLFHRSLRENIAYGKPDATDAEVRNAATQANAIEFIDQLPGGLDTVVGERGVKLSGGQRQRIAIARAILKNAPILILDEATSALDSESEKLIQSALENLMEGRTSIVIAHRLSTIAKLDRIIVLDHGKIVEDGTHKDLLKQNGIYASLWTHQSGGFIEE